MELKFFKLITGEEIIAEVVEHYDADEESYAVRNCLVFNFSQHPSGKLMITALPWGVHTVGLIHLRKEHIIYTGAPTQDLIEQYNSNFSPIATPKKGLITA